MAKKKADQLTEIKSKSNPHFLMDIDVLKDALINLHLARKNSADSRWDDSEEEGTAEDFGFKNAEALHAVLLPGGMLKGFEKEIQKREIQADLDSLLARCLTPEKGKTRLDYSPGTFLSPETKKSFVDFAATSLRLFILAKKLGYSGKSSKKTDELIMETTKALLQSAYLRDGGVAWSWILFQEKDKKYIPDTYFTSAAMIALNDVVNSEATLFSDEIKKGCKDTIIKGTYWLERRFKENLVTGNDEGGASSIVYYTYALTALLMCWDLLDEQRQKTCIKMVKAYLKILRDERTQVAPKMHHTILPSETKAASSYEDRSALGSVLTVLSLIKGRLGSDPDFDQSDFTPTMASIYEQVLTDRDMKTKLWPSARWKIYESYRAIEGLVNHALFTKTLPPTLNEQEILAVVMDVLHSKRVKEAIITGLTRRAEELAARDIEKSLQENKV